MSETVKTAHTPTPWAVENDSVTGDTYIVAGGWPYGHGICVMNATEFAPYDAKRIVRAVNSHDALVAVLDASERLARERANPAPDYAFRGVLHRQLEEASTAARAALSLANKDT